MLRVLYPAGDVIHCLDVANSLLLYLRQPPPHDMLGNTGGGLLTAVTSAVSAASKMWRFNNVTNI